MMRNRKLARVISDASWGLFMQMLQYKAEWYRRDIVKVNRFYPSSKTCSGCGSVKDKLILSERIYNCNSCGIVIDRDVNAALNILKEGQRISGIKIPEVPMKDAGVSQAVEVGSKRLT